MDLSDFSGTGGRSAVMVVKDDFLLSPDRFGRGKEDQCVMSEERPRRKSVVMGGKRQGL